MAKTPDVRQFFKDEARYTVNGYPAVDVTTIHNTIPTWSTIIPIGRFTPPTLPHAFERAGARRGAVIDNERREITHSRSFEKRPKGQPPKHAYTQPEVVAYMWDEMACRLDAQWRSVVESDEVRQRKTAYTHTHWPSDEVEWQNASRLIISGCASLADADMRDRSIEECIADVEETCARALCVQIDISLVKQLLSPIVINIVHGSTLLVRTICRRDIMHELVGESLSVRLRAYSHRTDFQLDDYSIADGSQSVTDVLLQELVHTRQRLTLVKDVGRTGRVEDVPMICGKSVFMPAPKFKHDVLDGIGIRSLKNFFACEGVCTVLHTQ